MSRVVVQNSRGWLPINEKRDLNLLKSCFKALHNAEAWPDYLKITKQECPKELHSNNSIRLVVPTENGTFQDNASKLFNNLPETITNGKDYRLNLFKTFKDFFKKWSTKRLVSFTVIGSH